MIKKSAVILITLVWLCLSYHVLAAELYSEFSGQYNGVTDDGLSVNMTMSADGTAVIYYFGLPLFCSYTIDGNKITLIYDIPNYYNSSIQGTIANNEIQFRGLVFRKEGTNLIPDQTLTDGGYQELMADSGYDMETESGTVLGSNISRSSILSVTFMNTLESAPADAWDVSASRDGSILAWAKPNGEFYDLTIAGNGVVRLNKSSEFLFAYYSNAREIRFNGCVDTSGVTTMYSLFTGCSALTELDLSNFDTSNVTDMSYMFHTCSALTTLDVSSFDTSNVKAMIAMFTNCSSLARLDISVFDTSNVTDMFFMFYGCSALTELDVSGFDTSNVWSMKALFYDCSSLKTLNLSNFNTSKVTDMSYMFRGCSALTSLDVSSFNTYGVSDMSRMFVNCSSLTNLDVSGFKTLYVTNMAHMFAGCSSLTELDVSSFNTWSVTEMAYMFSDCENLASILISERFVIGNGVNTKNMFTGCLIQSLEECEKRK